jgi:magnesium-transporting ATPase (P-type)
VIYFAQKVATLAVLLLVASVVTVSLNYVLLYLSFRKIKEMAEKEHAVVVVRDGVQVTISHTEIVPGDVIIL